MKIYYNEVMNFKCFFIEFGGGSIYWFRDVRKYMINECIYFKFNIIFVFINI